MEGKVSDLERLLLDNEILTEYFEIQTREAEEEQTLEAQIRKHWENLGLKRHEPN